MKKLALVLAGLLALAGIAGGCGSSTGSKPAGGDKKVVLKVGASPVPHAEILEKVKPILAKEGVDLQVVEFTDYVKPNLSLSDKEIDANFFQHLPYLEKFCKDRNLSLVSLGKVHIEPMGVYSKKSKKLNPCPTRQDRHSQRSHQRGPCPGHPGESRTAETEGRGRGTGHRQ